MFQLCNAGGVAPPEASTAPPGGGLGQLIKDTLAGPARQSAHPDRDKDHHAVDRQQDAAARPINPDLSPMLPNADAMVYGGMVSCFW